MTFTGVAILIEERSDFKKIKWPDCKKMLSNDFFGRLKGFKKDKISEKNIKALGKFIDQNPKFTPAEVASASAAGKSLCAWANAIYVYSQVVKKIEPLKEEVAKMNQEFESANNEL